MPHEGTRLPQARRPGEPLAVAGRHRAGYAAGMENAAARPGGIVRAPRRPPGWRPPGPPPRTPVDRPDAWPRAGEDLCHLAGDWRILQRVDGHRWSLDDLVTAWCAGRAVAAPPARILDLGCGIGAVLLLLLWRFPEATGLGVEVQATSVDLARRSLVWNGVAGRATVRAGDFREPAALAGSGVFPLVTGTPPYLPLGTATASRRPQRRGCHLEERGGIEAYCDAAAPRLAPGGRFVACESAPQAARVERAAAAAGLAIVARRDVVPRAGKPALFTVWTMRRADDPGPAAAVEPALVVRDRAGRRTGAFRALRADMGMPP